MTQYPPQKFFLQRIAQKFKVVFKIHEYKHVDLMQEGWIFSQYYIPDTEPKHIFLFLFYIINQIYVPHTNVVKQ